MTEHKTSIFESRCKFWLLKQEVDESLTEFTNKIKELALPCKFQVCCVNQMMRDNFMKGILNHEIRQKLFTANNDLQFNHAVKIALVMEFYIKTVNRIMNDPKSEIDFNMNPNLETGKSSLCFRCGNDHWRSPCKHEKTQCTICGKLGHVAKLCQGGKRPCSFVGCTPPEKDT